MTARAARTPSREAAGRSDSSLNTEPLYCSTVEAATHVSVLARFGHALSDPTRARLLLALREAPGYPAQLADLLGVTRQNLSNHLACLRGWGLVVAVPEGRRSRYELADPRLGHAVGDLPGCADHRPTVGPAAPTRLLMERDAVPTAAAPPDRNRSPTGGGLTSWTNAVVRHINTTLRMRSSH